MAILGMAVAVLLCSQQPAAAQKGLKLTLETDKAEYILGDEIEAEVTLTNGGAKALEVGALVFEERSLSFDVRFDSPKGRKEFRYAVVRPDPHLALRLAPPTITLRPGKSMTGIFRIPTLGVGSTEISAVYRGVEKQQVSTAAKVTVKSPSEGANRLQAILATSMGEIRIDLDPAAAPNNVSNFVSLAHRGFFDNLKFHRVVKDLWIQTGCGYGIGVGNSLGYALKSEAANQDLVHQEGTVSMSGNMKDGYTGSQFFIALKRLEALDKKFTVIGKVGGDGLEVAKKIGKVETEAKTDSPKEVVELKEVRIVAVK